MESDWVSSDQPDTCSSSCQPFGARDLLSSCFSFLFLPLPRHNYFLFSSPQCLIFATIFIKLKYLFDQIVKVLCHVLLVLV